MHRWDHDDCPCEGNAAARLVRVLRQFAAQMDPVEFSEILARAIVDALRRCRRHEEDHHDDHHDDDHHDERDDERPARRRRRHHDEDHDEEHDEDDRHEGGDDEHDEHDEDDEHHGRRRVRLGGRLRHD